ncbi:MAG: DUF6441 family protein [Brevundimonas sp.]
MRHSVLGREALDGFERGTEEEIAGYVTSAISENGVALKEDWRDQIRAARLGDRLANSVRSEVYPKGQNSLDAAALVWTKAPKIIGAYTNGATIRPVNGARYLWIPTDDVPKKRQGNRLTPDEVEARFGRPLVVINPGNHRLKTTPSRINRGVAYAGYSGLAIRRSSGRWRNASLRERTRGARSFREVSQAFVLMFNLVPLATVTKRDALNETTLVSSADARFDGLLSKHWR